MMEEFKFVSDAEEKLCFFADDFKKEMTRAHAIRKGVWWFDRE